MRYWFISYSSIPHPFLPKLSQKISVLIWRQLFFKNGIGSINIETFMKQ
jgi:hypothetical protein